MERRRCIIESGTERVGVRNITLPAYAPSNRKIACLPFSSLFSALPFETLNVGKVSIRVTALRRAGFENLWIRVRDRRNHRALPVLDDAKTSDVRDILWF